ncbi:glycosyltransferase family 4 protein [Microbacterium marinilacus]|uniref:D-inositol 3-phosphate glycosyltransferase n=1 Tax=Microbacterium marinilacus TaxID=415209 RepID=A0ABP7B1M2_9MICO|nr:glycosyltransferase family 4 protein [Microbacterium marinilacus]MBY0688646.1 glycosyltransferase family 4 protein [Microbacterium marinilacus]
MTRIALVCDYSLDYLGGAQSAFLDQAAILADRGHEVTVIAPGRRRRRRATRPATAAKAPRLDRFEMPASVTLPVVDLPVVRNARSTRRRLRAVLEARDIEVVHLHSEFGVTAAATDVARELGIPVVHTIHTFFWQTQMGPVAAGLAAPALRASARWLRGHSASRRRLAESRTDSVLRGMTLSTAERADVVISPSAHQAQRLRDAGLEDVVVIENAIPRATAPEAPLSGVDGPLRVVWVGRLMPEKRVREFVSAAIAAVRELGSGALDVEVIGDGPERGAIEAEIAAAGLEAAIHVRGRLTRDEVRDRMRRAHLVALTSFGFDNQPVVVVEAFNASRSVLYVDPALQEGLAEGGIRATSPDVAGMAETLVRLARDPEQVVRASERARRAAHVFAPARHAGLVEQAYDRSRGVTLAAAPAPRVNVP